MKNSFKISAALISLLAIIFFQCEPPPEPGTPEHIKLVTSKIDDDALANANLADGDWLTYGGNYQEDRYSKLDQVTKENIGELGLASTKLSGVHIFASKLTLPGAAPALFIWTDY